MSHALLSQLGSRGDRPASLDAYLDASGQAGWNRLRDLARNVPGSFDDEVLALLSRRIAEAPESFFALLLDLAAKDPQRRDALVARFHRHAADHPQPALGSAGYNLHEHQRLLDAAWVDFARQRFDADPEGAWSLLTSAAMYHPQLLDPAAVDWLDARRAGYLRDHGVVLLSLARHHTAHAPDLIARAVRSFAEDPAAAVEAAAFAARDHAPLLVPPLIAAVLAHLPAAPEKAWEFFDGAAQARPELFDEALLDALTAQTTTSAGKLLAILRRLVDIDAPRARSLLDRYVALVRRFPAEGIGSVRYAFQGEDIRLVRPDLVQALCAGFAADAYPAYEFLRRCAEERPELIGAPEVEAAIRNIAHATNYAFGFFKVLLGLRPEFTRECTLALFECLALEPVNRAFVRAEEMESLIAISEAAHIRTGLEAALREPPRVGSRRARALMAIMFRQKLRARRQVLLEALRYAATVVLWRKSAPEHRGADGEESQKFSPIWDFLLFIIDHSGDDAVSTAAAERFLEGAFQLHYLCATGAEHEDFLRKLDLGHPPRAPFPAGAGFLAGDAELAGLHDLVSELRRRFASEPRPGPLEEFAGRATAAESELRAIGGQLARADEVKRGRLAERERALRRQLELWRDPGYQRACDDPAAEAALPSDARALLKRERKDLAKRLRDSLRAESIAVAVAAVERSRLALYRNRVRDVLGREVDLAEVETRILPAFLWFQAIGNMPGNERCLRRLIEDRIAGRAHDWLRTEPPALAWAARVRESRPSIRLERWRAPFARTVQYRAQDAVAEKRRRIKADLAQTRALLERAGAKGLAAESYEALAAALAALRDPAPATGENEGAGRRAPADPALLEEAAMNLERVRIAEQVPDSDYEGSIELAVESDPFEILFMGEYGFASCLSLRGINAWSAVSNAVDIDKTVVWAREPGGNVVGRRLLALMPEGILSFRTYTNRHGLGLDRAFADFIAAYAAHCGTVVAHGGHPQPLLSDRWYDDGAI